MPPTSGKTNANAHGVRTESVHGQSAVELPLQIAFLVLRFAQLPLLLRVLSRKRDGFRMGLPPDAADDTLLLVRDVKVEAGLVIRDHGHAAWQKRRAARTSSDATA